MPAATKHELLTLIDRAIADGWDHRRACAYLELGETRAWRWRERRAAGTLEDRRPGGGALHVITPDEEAAIVTVFEAHGLTDRSHRKLAHRARCGLIKPRICGVESDANQGQGQRFETGGERSSFIYGCIPPGRIPRSRRSAMTDEPNLDYHPKRIANPDAKCPRHPKKDWRPLVQQAWEAGWWCEWGGHYIRCWPKDPTAEAVSLPSTPSGSRSLMNYKKKLQRSGLPKH